MASVSTNCRNLRWFFNFSAWEPSELEICRAFSTIQEEERERIHQFKYQSDAKASLVGRLMYRKAVSSLVSLENNNFLLKRTQRGRPYIENVRGLELNVSHAGAITVLAAHFHGADTAESCSRDIHKHAGKRGLLLGVDVMPLKDSRVERTEEFFRLMRRQFTKEEWETIKEPKSDEGKLRNFYRNWSLKESYVKAVGTGLNIDLQSINFKIRSELSQSSPIFDTEVEVGGEKDYWRFEECLIGEHVVSVAVNNCTDIQLQNWRELGIDELLPSNETLLKEVDLEDWSRFNKKEKLKPF